MKGKPVQDEQILVVDPVAPGHSIAPTPSARVALQGATVGFLDNGWRSWTRVLEHMQATLLDRGAIEVHRWDIPVSIGAEDTTIKRSAKVCDLCVVGLGN